jgi:hypothetical protein
MVGNGSKKPFVMRPLVLVELTAGMIEASTLIA